MLLTLSLPLVVILKAAPFVPLVLPPFSWVGAGAQACRGGEGSRGEGGRGVRRLAGGGGERQASRFPPLMLEFGLSLRLSASLLDNTKWFSKKFNIPKQKVDSE